MRLVASTTADSIVVFGSETFVKLSHGHAGTMPGKSGLGGISAARMKMMALKIAAARTARLIRRHRRKKFSFMAELLATPLVTFWQRANVEPIREQIDTSPNALTPQPISRPMGEGSVALFPTSDAQKGMRAESGALFRLKPNSTGNLEPPSTV
jgi:hypothetical protein